MAVFTANPNFLKSFLDVGCIFIINIHFFYEKITKCFFNVALLSATISLKIYVSAFLKKIHKHSPFSAA